jgi:sodium transport system permease protein
MFYSVKKIKYFFIGILLWIGAVVVSGIYSYYAMKILPSEELIESFKYIFSETTFTQQVVIMAVIPAVVEEMFFRGIMFNSLKKKAGVKAAAVVSYLLFASMHFSLIKIFPTFLLGVVFTYVVYKTGSILPAVVLHFINNFMSVAVQHLIPDVELDNLAYTALNYKIILVFTVIYILYNFRGNYEKAKI